jgi:hypothetical protein
VPCLARLAASVWARRGEAEIRVATGALLAALAHRVAWALRDAWVGARQEEEHLRGGRPASHRPPQAACRTVPQALPPVQQAQADASVAGQLSSPEPRALQLPAAGHSLAPTAAPHRAPQGAEHSASLESQTEHRQEQGALAPEVARQASASRQVVRTELVQQEQRELAQERPAQEAARAELSA